MATIFLILFIIIISLLIVIISVLFNLKKKPNQINQQQNYFQSVIDKLVVVKIDENQVSNAQKNLFNGNNNLWDPVEKIELDTIRKNAAEIEIKIEEFRKDPKKIKKRLNFILITCFILSFLILFFLYKTNLLFEKDGLNIAIGLIMVIFGIYFGVKKYYKSLTVDLIKLEIAIEKGWIYNPNHDINKLNNLKTYFPEIFIKGNQGQYIEDQFWGITKLNNNSNYFYTGLFYYEIRSGSGKNTKVTPYTTHYFIFPLKKDIGARFHLYPEDLGSKITNFFSNKEINVESNEFNKTFAFTYDGSKGEKAQEIVKTLTPVMQEKLIKLNQKKGTCEILFARNTVVFLFNKDIIDNMKTDFMKNSQINPADLKEIDNKLTELITISDEMSKYLD